MPENLDRHYAETCGYASLELPDVGAAALADPRGFLEAYPSPVIFGEVRYARDLLPYVKERIDADWGLRGLETSAWR